MNKAKSEQHPITPSPELVREWAKTCSPYEVPADHIAAQAARWGFRQCIKADAAWLEDKLQKARDQELEACVEWLRTNIGTSFSSSVESELRAVRRPKPPSLAEQALAKTEAILNDPSRVLLTEVREALEYNRRTLRRLQELEQENNG